MNASDSVFRLSAQVSATREKERRAQIKKVDDMMHSLETKLIHLEESISSFPKLIKETIKDEIQKTDNTPSIMNEMDRIKNKIDSGYQLIDAKYKESNKKIQKMIKKLKTDLQLAANTPKDDSRVEEISMQIDEMKRRQNLMLDLLNTMKSHNDKDFDLVNSQITQMWSQISQKRD